MALSVIMSTAVLFGSMGRVAAEETAVSSTNLDGVSITPSWNFDGEYGYIGIGNEDEVLTDPSHCYIFVNGSLLKESIIDSENLLAPLRAIAEALGAEVEWLPEEQAVIINDYATGTKTKLYIYDSKANMVTGDDLDALGDEYNTVIELDDMTRLRNDGRTYISLDGFEKIFGATVTSYLEAPMINNEPHWMIDRYSEYAVALTEEEAREIAREQLLIAYELKFVEFEVLDGEEIDYGNDPDAEKTFLRKKITNLELINENERFYRFDVAYEFWVDKYTGEVYTYYNGTTMSINLFDPYNVWALAFPG